MLLELFIDVVVSRTCRGGRRREVRQEKEGDKRQKREAEDAAHSGNR